MNVWIRPGLTVVSALVYFYIAYRLGDRATTYAADQRAWTSFRLWWLLLALNTAVNPLSVLLAAAGILSLAVHLGLTLFGNLALSVALWGLLYYLVYIYTGQENVRRWLGLVYGIFYTGILFFTWQRMPLSVDYSGQMVSIVYQNEPNTLFTLVLLALLILPTILASLALLNLFFQVDDRSQKYRLILVSTALLIWFGSAFIAVLTSLSSRPWWPLFSQTLGLLAALSIFWAYFPPAFVRKRLSVSGIS